MTTATVTAPLGQFTRFLVVGAANTASASSPTRCSWRPSTPYVLAAAIAFAAGAVNGYVLNRRWTFSARDTNRARIAYACVQAAGAITTGMLVWLLAHEASAGSVGAYLLAIPPVTLATFLANRAWTFAARN